MRQPNRLKRLRKRLVRRDEEIGLNSVMRSENERRTRYFVVDE